MGVAKWTFVIISILVAYASYKFIYKNEIKSAVIQVGNLGSVQGIVSTSRDGREFSEYLGVPYAKPPIKALRFESPKEVEPWNGLKIANRPGSECPQRSMLTGNPGGNEDCLYLNVFVPKVSKTDLLPVMFWIHGGAFYEGSNTFYHPHYFMDHEVILVTINYRLGALGFLNTNDGLVRGNMGLKDQNMALRFVNKYIQYFGGDKNRVTIFGESAGGASVHYHMMSPLSKGLFQKAISQSGTAFIPRAFFKGDTADQAKRLARQVNCATSSAKEMVACLKTIPPSKFVELNQIDIKNPVREVISLYEPTKESVIDADTFLSDQPYNLVSNLKSTVPWISGMNSQEGLLVEAALARSDEFKQILFEDWTNKMPYFLHMNPKYTEIMDKIKEFYFQRPGEKTVHLQYDDVSAMNYTNLLSDRFFLYGFHEAVKLHVEKSLSPTFIYYFEYDRGFSIYTLLTALKGKYPPMVEVLLHFAKTWINKHVYGIETPTRGVCHADELQYFFRMEHMNSIDDKRHESYELSKELVRLWVSFARNEEPLHFHDVEWQPVQKSSIDKLKYLRIGETVSIVEEPFRDRMLFWDALKDYYWGRKA